MPTEVTPTSSENPLDSRTAKSMLIFYQVLYLSIPFIRNRHYGAFQFNDFKYF
jgi:hypothetical protein